MNEEDEFSLVVKFGCHCAFSDNGNQKATSEYDVSFKQKPPNFIMIFFSSFTLIALGLLSRFVYVIAWAREQLRINFTSIFKVFTKLPESLRDSGNLENFENTSEINP